MAVELAGEEARGSKISFKIDGPGCEPAPRTWPSTGLNWNQDQSLGWIQHIQKFKSLDSSVIRSRKNERLTELLGLSSFAQGHSSRAEGCWRRALNLSDLDTLVCNLTDRQAGRHRDRQTGRQHLSERSRNICSSTETLLLWRNIWSKYYSLAVCGW